jgi:hypothetical protein
MNEMERKHFEGQSCARGWQAFEAQVLRVPDGIAVVTKIRM